MNILDRIEFYKRQYEELSVLPDLIESYLSGYEIEDKSVDEMIEEFFYVFGECDITKRDFIFVAKSLGYEYMQVYRHNRRFYTLIRE